MGSSVRYNRTLEPYLRSRGRENEVINDFCHAPFFESFKMRIFSLKNIHQKLYLIKLTKLWVLSFKKISLNRFHLG